MFRNSPSSPRVAIVGGGAIGLASAWTLARAGASVTVLEAGETAGQGALAASGGMLAQGFEGANEDAGRAFVALAARSLALWDGWARELTPRAKAPLGYRRDGSISPALGAEGPAWLDGLEANARQYGIGAERLDAGTVRELEPSLGEDVAGALRFPGDGEIDNRALGPALAAAVVAAGGKIHTRWPVERIEDTGGRVTLSGPAGRFEAERVVLAAGWKSAALSRDVPEAAALIPVKGQMLSLEPVIALNHCVRAKSVYLSAKPDRIVVGATSEEGASDDRVDPEQTVQLKSRAAALFPALADARVLEAWCGVRPGTPDGLPLIGHSVCEGVVLGLGAYRNGVLLAPAMAEAIRDIVLGQGTAEPAFDPQRFVTALTQG